MVFSYHPLHEKQLAYFRHLKYQLEARETQTKSNELRRHFLQRQKIKNYQNEHDRISYHLRNSLVPDTIKRNLQNRVDELTKLGASAVVGIQD